MDQGTLTLLACVVDTKRMENIVASVLVVSEFLDSFSEDLLGLSLAWEVDFNLELEPGTTPISNIPYRMTLAELKELKI